MKIITDQELKDYLEALYHLLDIALTKCESKWTADLQNELLHHFEAMKQRKSAENIYEYVVSFAHLLQLFLMLQEILRCYDSLKKQYLLQM